MGRSTFQPGRSIADWPDDVSELLAHLGVERFRVLGYSGGGPFALACGWLLSPRIDRLTVVSGCGPVDGLGDLVDTGLLDLWLAVTARWAPPLADASLGLMALVARRLPGFAARAWEADLLPAERKVAQGGTAIDPAVRLAFFVEAMALGPRGSRHDYRLISEPWGFLPEEVEVPVVLWHGDADRIVPLHDAAELQIRLPRSELRVVPGAGHLLLQASADEILGTLAL
jgi:pimeloyl-ACP methyl ester carboxylesterase